MFVKMGEFYVNCESCCSEDISFLLRASEEHVVDYEKTKMTRNSQLDIIEVSFKGFLPLYISSLDNKVFEARRIAKKNRLI